MQKQDPSPSHSSTDTEKPRSSPLADFLREHQEQLLVDWEQALCARVPEQPLERALLRDHLPGLLLRLADVAEQAQNPQAMLLPQLLSDAHALQRLEHGLYLGHITLEYGLLRHCILRGLQREGLWPSFAELERLNEALDQSILRATSLYTHVYERMLKALERVSEATLGSESLDTFLPRLLGALQEAVFTVDGASILLREDGELRLRAAVGIGAREALDAHLSLSVDEGLSGHVVHERKPLQVRLAAQHPELHSELVRRLGVRAAYSVPLLHGEQVVGVAHMCSRTVFDFNPADQLLFRVMMTRATSFIVQVELAERERAARAAAQRSLAQLDTLLKASPVGVCLMDRDLRYQHVNDTLAELNGQPVAAHLGRTLREVVPAWVVAMLEPHFRHVLEAGEPVSNHEFTSHPRDGGGPSRQWLGNYYPVRGADGAVVGLGCVVVDITQQKDVEAELRRSGELRERLIGVVGHDLRNPLSAIDASALLLQRQQGLDARAQRTVERIRSSAARMARMIGDILDFARSSNGGVLPVHREPVDLHAICRAVLDEFQVAHAQRRFELETHGEGTGAWDADRLTQVVSNLVGNALQHGREDSPVRVGVREAGHQVRLSVHNEGEPIPAALRETLFQPFRHGASGKAASRSVGLGLYIVRQVALAHGGEVEVRSEPDEGTTFTVTLPRAEG
jgi:PAS domain S-box-containing protein